MYFDQSTAQVRCEWGSAGLAACLPGSAAVVIVDVLSFCTAVEVAVSRGARVYPYRYRDESAADFAKAHQALLAGTDRTTGYSLSPASLRSLPRRARLVLPSPNGSTLSLGTGGAATYAGCLRNASAVAQAAARHAGPVSVIAAGERWADGSLRPAIEDLIGAGAILQHLPGSRSPEAALAVAAFEAARDQLESWLAGCGSGRELIARGSAADVALATELDVSEVVPHLVAGAYEALDSD